MSSIFDKVRRQLGVDRGSSLARDAGPGTSIADIVNRSGRASLPQLMQAAVEMSGDAFVEYVGNPLLVGRAIREGTLSASAEDPLASLKSKTMFFKPVEVLAIARAVASSSSESLQEAVYPLVKSPESASPDPAVFTIGRLAGNDLVIPDFAVSKRHARIEVVGKRYFLSDLGSSNGTAVNGSSVSRTKVEVKARDGIRFARYEFSFVSPEMLQELLRELQRRRTNQRKSSST